VRCKDVQITIRSQQRSQRARVVYVDEAHEGEFAIELERPEENFWGVYFPLADWKPLDLQQSEVGLVGDMPPPHHPVHEQLFRQKKESK
jgi:hypothetical protein